MAGDPFPGSIDNHSGANVLPGGPALLKENYKKVKEPLIMGKKRYI